MYKDNNNQVNKPFESVDKNSNSNKADLSDSQQEVDNSTGSSAFLEDDINRLYTNTPEKVQRTNHILNLIRENPGITSYGLKKHVSCSYTEITRVIRDLEYCGLIQTKVILVLGRANKRLYAVSGEEKNE